MAGRRRSILALGLFTFSLAPIYSTSGSETVTYTYDDRGRLVLVNRGGTINDGIQASYSYDGADNRSNVTVSGPGFSVNDVASTEGAPLTFTVTRSSSGAAASISYATSNGTAAAGSDYTATGGMLNFAVGEASKPINVPTTDDTTSESAESVTLTLSNPVGGALIDGTGVGTINDNDAPPACGGVSFMVASNAAVTEGANSVFTVTKIGTATGSCGVSYATANGTAAAGSDYTAVSGSLTFTTAQASQTVSVATTDDAAVESAETLSLSLSAPTGGSVIGSPGSATATINDNDGVTCSGVGFSVNNVTVLEGDPLAFTVTKSGAAAGSCSVSYATANGSAISPNDYAAVSGTLTFAQNETSKTVSTTTVIAGPNESTEIMYLNLSSPSGGATLTDGQGQGTIQNNFDGCITC